MKAKTLALILPALLLVLGSTPVFASTPAIPHAFYGDVTINKSPAPAGTKVEARGSGVLPNIEGNPITTTQAGKYGGLGALDPKLVVQGDIEDGTTITFYVTNENGTAIGGTASFEAGGGPTCVDLSVTITEPTPGVGLPPDTTPPIISNVFHCGEGVTETTADICWETNEKSDSQVEYWSNPSKLSPLDEEMVINHHVQLTGLVPDTTYYYKTMSRDEAGNLGVSDEYTFTTKAKAPAAAAFAISDLSISPSEVAIGQTVTISAIVTNTGGETGSYTVTFKINGVVEATKEVTLKPGASQEVTFTTAKDAAGSYEVAVNGISGSFTVKEEPALPVILPPMVPPEVEPPTNWPLIGGIIAAVIAVGLLIFFSVRKRGRAHY